MTWIAENEAAPVCVRRLVISINATDELLDMPDRAVMRAVILEMVRTAATHAIDVAIAKSCRYGIKLSEAVLE